MVLKTGWREKKAQGRPVSVAIAQDGTLLVADDVGNVIWCVTLTEWLFINKSQALR